MIWNLLAISRQVSLCRLSNLISCHWILPTMAVVMFSTWHQFLTCILGRSSQVLVTPDTEPLLNNLAQVPKENQFYF